MARNTYSTTSPENTVLLAKQIILAVNGNPTDFGLSTAQMQHLTNSSTILNNENGFVLETRQAARAAVQSRISGNRACKMAIADIARSVYADADLTPAQIASLGLQPRKTDRTKVVPVTPTDLTATVQANGDIVVKFKRGANAAGVIFRVEEQAPGGEWAFADETTATRLVLKGYAAGETVAFRVVATKNGIAATPTGMVTVYQTAVAAPALRLAA